jgi:hypothetical protein
MSFRSNPLKAIETLAASTGAAIVAPVRDVAAVVAAPFVAPVVNEPPTAFGGGFFVKPGSRTLKSADLTKPFAHEWGALGMKLANGATKRAPDMNIFKATSIFDFTLKKQIVSGVSDVERKALVNAFGTMKLPVSDAELAEMEKKMGLAKTVEKRVKKFVNIEEEKEIADFKAANKDEAKAFRQAGLKAIRDKHKPPAKGAVGGATSADTVDTASEAELSDEELAKEFKQEDVDKVARALKKFHGEIGEPPYHVEKVKAELEKVKTEDLKDLARDLKLSGKISKMNKNALIALITNFMETD